MDCHWFITGDAGKVLKLTFTTFNLEAPDYDSGEQICYDFVEVYLFSNFHVYHLAYDFLNA